uniref:Gypsy retrotransposon integrase-like protein 1 n=1 Tax=Monopterus albus TaxID=43700 RepID=A0A3Q3JX63_MONAL
MGGIPRGGRNLVLVQRFCSCSSNGTNWQFIGVLYRVSKDPLSNQKRFQYVLPFALLNQALSGIHDLAGHQGQDRTLYLARQRFYWPDMKKDIRTYVRQCQRCTLGKSPEPAARAPLESIRSSAPMELVCMDFWSVEDSKQRSVDVLVITDHFTKLAHAFPCANQTAKQIAKKLWDCVFCVYGFPERIPSDQGTNFGSKLIAELFQLAGVAKSRTTAYHPMGNGGTERFNRTLSSMLRTLPGAKQHWPEQIQTLTFAYNATIHETTGYAPFFLMFGRVPRLPVDIMFSTVLNDSDTVDYDSYAKSLLADLKNVPKDTPLSSNDIKLLSTTNVLGARTCLSGTVFWLQTRVSMGRRNWLTSGRMECTRLLMHALTFMFTRFKMQMGIQRLCTETCWWKSISCHYLTASAVSPLNHMSTSPALLSLSWGMVTMVNALKWVACPLLIPSWGMVTVVNALKWVACTLLIMTLPLKYLVIHQKRALQCWLPPHYHLVLFARTT